MLNIFAHGANDGIELGTSDRLDITEFRKTFSRDQELLKTCDTPVFTLSFLNGCNTSAGDGIDSFLVATAERDFCGFIGVEAPIPNHFALLYWSGILVFHIGGWQLRW